METTACNFIQGEKKKLTKWEKERKRLEKIAKNEENYSLYLLLVEHYENEWEFSVQIEHRRAAAALHKFMTKGKRGWKGNIYVSKCEKRERVSLNRVNDGDGQLDDWSWSWGKRARNSKSVWGLLRQKISVDAILWPGYLLWLQVDWDGVYVHSVNGFFGGVWNMRRSEDKQNTSKYY